MNVLIGPTRFKAVISEIIALKIKTHTLVTTFQFFAHYFFTHTVTVCVKFVLVAWKNDETLKIINVGVNSYIMHNCLAGQRHKSNL